MWLVWDLQKLAYRDRHKVTASWYAYAWLGGWTDVRMNLLTDGLVGERTDGYMSEYIMMDEVLAERMHE